MQIFLFLCKLAPMAAKATYFFASTKEQTALVRYLLLAVGEVVAWKLTTF